ncbi:MAG: hypothetical protein JO040_08135 [Gemmatimonadetes bacterium]|nr:hypothetical protein [Gemmatimonadota bacterium]
MRRVTGAVLLVGLVLLVWALASPERRRARLASRLQIGDDTARVAQLFGPPGARCPGASLDHLRDRFPIGTPGPAMQQALDRMQSETAQRWVFPLGGGPAGCVPGQGSTEVGVDRSGHVRWFVPVTGRIPLVLPNDYQPASTGA